MLERPPLRTHPAVRRGTLLAPVALVAAIGAFAALPDRAGAVVLPPALTARLEADRAGATTRLAALRRQVAAAAPRAAAATAEVSRLQRREQVVRAVLGSAPVAAGVRDATVGRFTTAADAAMRARTQAQQALDRATAVAAEAQGDALDADRRIRALERAISAASQRAVVDTGSWRFGSGGPSVSAATLDRYLASKASPMTGQGDAFLRSGLEHEIDPRLLVAIAGAESYFGLITCAPFNGWGWGCPDGPFRFTSWADGIDTVTRGLRTGYVDDGLTTVGAIHLRYAPPAATNDPTGLNYGWADNVAGFLIEQGGDPEQVDGVVRASSS